MTETSGKWHLLGGIISIFGFLLSPLSWWNDLIFNIPIAYAMSAVLTKMLPLRFSFVMILSYWFTNVAGFVLMHKGGSIILGHRPEPWRIQSILKDLSISVVYTLLIAILIGVHVLKLPAEYFH